MRLRERSVIARPAATVWPYIIRPEYFPRWNAKISAMDATGEFRVGQPFTTHYEWNGKPMQCATVATDIQEGRVLELLHTHLIGPGIRPDMEIRERITLHELRGGTQVTKVVTIRNHGAAWYWIVLIWLIGNFGTRVEPDLLKQMCEREA
jgi:uncharacterized protein YndB with AHSA1/START domain